MPSSDDAKKGVEVINHLSGRSIVPFTGVFFAIWAFFSPESYGS